MAVKEDDYENLKKLAEKRRLGIRKRKLKALLTSKRNFFANNISENAGQPNNSEEVKEVKEDQGDMGKLDLSGHKKRRKLSRKKCWSCSSSSHFKNKCPYIRCYFCHKQGHMKKDCHFSMIKYVFQKVKEDVERKKRNKRKTNKKEETRKNREGKKFR